MRKLSFLWLLFSFVFAQAQKDSTIFLKQNEVATSDYVFMVPKAWKLVPEIDASSKNKKYELNGAALPAEFNNAPVTGTMTLRKYECNKNSVAIDYIISEITSVPERQTPPGQNYDTSAFVIVSGERATLITTKYARPNKHLNFSRYDLVVYSNKRKAAYMFTVTFQYRDATYAFETEYRLKQYAMKFFSGIQLR